MQQPAGAPLLIALARPLQRDPPRVARAGVRAVALAAVADATQEEELPAVRSDADDQPQRIHRLPRSGRGGWTSTPRCAKKGAANVALPRVISPEGPGWSDSGPSPLSAVGGTGLPQPLPQGNQLAATSRSRIPRFLVIVNKIGPRDRQEPQLAVGLFHPQRVAAVAGDDLDALAAERMNGQPDRRHRPARAPVRPRGLRLARLGLGSALCLSLSGASGAP